MKNKMKMFSTVSFMALALSQSAFAKIQEGHYQRGITHAFVKTVGTDSYGMVWVENQSTALYRVEELSDGTQAWIKFELKNNMLTANLDEDATYAGTVFAQNGAATLKLEPTELGRIEATGVNTQMILRESNDYAWDALPVDPISYKTGESEKALRKSNVASTKKVSGTVFTRGADASGNYSVRLALPLVGGLHLIGLDSESSDGRAVTRSVDALMVVIKKDCWLTRPTRFIGFFDLSQKITQMKLYKLAE